MIRAFQWDLARQTERLGWLRAQLPRYADWGYQELYLHLEDAVDYPSLPGVARRDAYTYREFETLVAAADRAGLRVVPIANLLGHTQYLVKVPALRDLNERRAADGSPLPHGQICPVHPRTSEVAEKLLRDLAPFCTAGKVHVGLDESFHLGQHPLSRADIAARGLAGHFAAYAGRLHALAARLGLRMGLWADMLYHLPEAIPLLPRGAIAYDWYYYPFGRRPRVELFNFAERDLAPALRAQGIDYWGCPMNGAFRHEPLPVFGERLANIESWWDRCRRVRAEGMLVTSWEASRLAVELTTAVDAAAAGLWLEPGVRSRADRLARGFARTGEPGAPAARSALAADAVAFSGYARWEINDRWDICPDDPGPCERELATIARLLGREDSLPAPLAASLRFRHYLALRDVFVRRNVRAVFQLRRQLAAAAGDREEILRSLALLQRQSSEFSTALREGRAAARAMWRSTRDRREHGPNELLVAADTARLRDWRRWLARAAARPALVRGATPVCGAWQLRFVVHNFAPALQQVVVEQRQPDGSWRTLRRRFTIEFRAAAARPRARIRREFVVPVSSSMVKLRIAVRGVGEVRIGRIELTDGVTRLSPRGWTGTGEKKLGKPAPRRGLPALDLARNNAALPLAFPRASAS
ncbi:MAG TPA: family 20 glycosylhydrolase [Opitutaceae bacterium]|nr:family 20 glycosylhydrolase [Opitutaceae bacterium]